MNIVVVTGASGGHIFPAISFIRALTRRHPDARILLVLPEQRVIGIDFTGIETAYLGIPALRRSPLGSLLVSLYRLLRGSFRALRILINFNPSLVIGFGSAPSVPVVFLAWFLRIKTMIHEQNVVPGKANLLLAKFCDAAAVSFEETVPLLGGRAKAVVTGNPVRPLSVIEKGAARISLGLESGRLTVLVTGGSQGSARINGAVTGAMGLLPGKDRFQLIHITGKAGREAAAQSYAASGVTALTVPFLSSMDAAYSAADLVICRAGAATIFELMFFALPAIIVPYPYAYGHQAANASILERKGCCRVVKDQEFDAPALAALLEDMAGQPQLLAQMKTGYRQLVFPEAAAALADQAFALAGLGNGKG